MALVERAELERLRQKQIKEYNPVLSQLASIQGEIERVLRTSKLPIDERLGLLTLLHSRFDNLYKTIKFNGGLSIPASAAFPVIPPPGVPPPPAAANNAAPQVILAPPPLDEGPVVPADAPVDMPPGDEGIGQFEPIADPLERQADEGSEDTADDEPPVEHKGIQTPRPVKFPDITNLKIAPNFKKKYDELVQRLSPYPHLINISEDGEIVLNGNPIPSSSFNDLLTSLFQNKENLNLEGEDEFFDVLRDLKIKEDHISTKEAKSKLVHSRHSRETPLSPTKFEDASEGMIGKGRKRKKNHHSVGFTAKAQNSIPKSHHAKNSKSQHTTSNSKENKLGPPPGKRPHILHLYP